MYYLFESICLLVLSVYLGLYDLEYYHSFIVTHKHIQVLNFSPANIQTYTMGLPNVHKGAGGLKVVTQLEPHGKGLGKPKTSLSMWAARACVCDLSCPTLEMDHGVKAQLGMSLPFSKENGKCIF